MNYILHNADVSVLISDENIAFDGVITIDTNEAKTFSKYNFGALKEYKLEYTDNSEVYVLYTSGSTGFPKGCSITYQNLLYILNNMKNKFSCNDAVYVFSTPYNFDVSIPEIFSWNFKAKVLVIDMGNYRYFKKLPAIFNEYKVTHFSASPSSFLNLINTLGEENVRILTKTLKYLLIAGEVFKNKIFKLWKKIDTPFRLFNLYGPTESTVYATYFELKKNGSYENGIPIGSCFDGCGYEVINYDENGVGELILTGDGICNGYINKSNSNFNNYTDMKSYRTGDLVSLENGVLLYHGRIDDQIQINGIRVEIGEIEYYLQEISGVIDAAVVFDKDILIANIVFEDKNNRNKFEEEIKKIPRYLQPHYVEFVETLPTNQNNKIDRKKILANYDKKFKNSRNTSEEYNQSIKKIIEFFSLCLAIPTEELNQDSDFMILGGDSLSIFNLAYKLESYFSIIINADELYIERTPIAIYNNIIIRNYNSIDNKEEITDSTFVSNLTPFNSNVIDFLFQDTENISRRYSVIHNQKNIYFRKYTKMIHSNLFIGYKFSKDEIEHSIVNTIEKNNILRSKISHDSDRKLLIINEYSIDKNIKIPFIQMKSEPNYQNIHSYILGSFGKLIYNSRYANGFLGLFAISECTQGYCVHIILDHIISDAYSISRIKKLISENLLNKNEYNNNELQFSDYCMMIQKNNSAKSISDSWYFQERKKCLIYKKDEYLNALENSFEEKVLRNIKLDTSEELSILIAYYIGKKILDKIGINYISLKTIFNLREFNNYSFKDTIGDIHSNISLLLHKNMTFKEFKKRSFEILDLYKDSFYCPSYVIHNENEEDKELQKFISKVFDQGAIVSINYLGNSSIEEIKKIKSEIFTLQDKLNNIEEKILVTAYKDQSDLHLFVNKNIF